jgi:hypothetical protein
MTDAEVAALASKPDAGVARRIAAHSPSAPLGRLASEKAAPPRITAEEMVKIARTQVTSKDLRARLAKGTSGDVPAGGGTSDKDGPTREAPVKA